MQDRRNNYDVTNTVQVSKFGGVSRRIVRQIVARIL